MKNAFFRKVIAIAMAISIVAPVLVSAPTASADANALLWGGQRENVRTGTGLGNQDPRTIIANVIKVLLGFLGIIAVIIILIGGFKWMTSQGSDEKVEEARKLITSGFVGLLIVLSAFGLATFILDRIFDVTTNATV